MGSEHDLRNVYACIYSNSLSQTRFNNLSFMTQEGVQSYTTQINRASGSEQTTSIHVLLIYTHIYIYNLIMHLQHSLKGNVYEITFAMSL